MKTMIKLKIGWKKVKIMKRFKWIVAGGALSLFAVTFFLSNTNYVKAENNTNACSSSYVQKTYLDHINYTQSGNVVTFSGATGLYYRTGDNNTPQYPDANGNFTVVISGSQLELQFFLQATDGVCNQDESIATYTLYAEVSEENELYNNEICINYRNKWSDNETMKNAVPYCFSEYVTRQYSYDVVRGWINDAESSYNNGMGQSSSITIDEETNVDDVKSGVGGTCNYYTDSNQLTYSHVETSANGGGQSCKQTCKETITITFDGPVAAQVGMCLGYSAEVTSTVECEYVYTAPIPSYQTSCVPTASCYSSQVGETSKGGPNDEFDLCVMQCDGGEYSQSCIDSCYNKVYEEEESVVGTSSLFTTFGSLLTYQSQHNGVIEPVADDGCLTPWNVDPNNEDQIRQLYEQHQLYPGGQYVDGHWISGGTCASSIGQYYFSTLEHTRDTVNQIHGNWVDQFGRKSYCAAEDGFLRQCSLNGVANWCDDACHWVDNCSSGSAETEYLAEQNYQAQREAYEAAKQSCESKNTTQNNTCSTEKVTYTIDVDNDSSSSEQKDVEDFTDSFSAEQLQGSNTIGGNYPSMVDASGLCMGESSDTTNDYHALLTFPEAFIHNKTGQVVYGDVPKGSEDFYTSVGNQFCTKLTSVPTNTAWYVWKVDENADQSLLTSEKREEIEDDTVTNIHVGVDNFGYFGWNIDLSCFYALTNPNNPPDGDTPGGNEGDDPTKDFIFRPISLTDVFPNERAPRFNWTCGGTNLNNSSYPVEPVALTELIEERGQEIYAEENEGLYLDYYIEISPEDINQIRDYNKKWGGNYSEPKADNENVAAGSNKTAGITVYRSSFLHNYLGSDVVKRFGLIGCNNQATGGNGNGTGTCDVAVYQDGSGCYYEYASESVH